MIYFAIVISKRARIPYTRFYYAIWPYAYQLEVYVLGAS